MQLPYIILYEDKDILVVEKQAGIPVQTGRIGCMDLESFLKNYLAKKGESTYLAVIHRLDQPVRGLLVFGKNEKAAARLSAMVQAPKNALHKGKKEDTSQFFQKEYIAVVRGSFPEEEVTLTDHLVKEVKGNLSRIVSVPKGGQIPQNAKKAVLKAQRVSWEEICSVCPKPVSSMDPDWQQAVSSSENSLVKINLYTGRHHQIRVQMAGAGYPLVGDGKYGGVNDGKALRLCAFHLVFSHPVTGKKMEFWAYPTALND